MSKASIDQNQRIIRTRDLLESEVDGDIIALSIQKGMCYGFNNVGSRVWGLLAEETSITEICGVLASEFEVDEQVCRDDVTKLVTELSAEGLVEVRG